VFLIIGVSAWITEIIIRLFDPDYDRKQKDEG
jgi:hypothetical protein